MVGGSIFGSGNPSHMSGPEPMSDRDPASHRVTVVIPVYNAERSLKQLVHELIEVLRTLGPAFEVVLVDDGSRDGSWQEVVGLAAQFAEVRGIRMMRNFGQHNAILCGVRAARFEVVVTMDDDLQHPPHEIPRLLHALEGADVVYGTPRGERHDVWRAVASRVTKLALQSVMGAETARSVSAFRAFRTQLRRAFDDYRSPFLSIDVLLTWATTRFTAIEVEHRERQYGVSNYSFRQLVAHAVNMMTGFSVLPLQIASITGFVFTVFGLAILAFVVGRYLIHGTTVPGFSFLASVVAIFSGAQLFALGIIGEYLARMHFRMMERPTYAVSETTEQ
jgi:undecaprenyl-phosphate 4-deoxy-4-formamido-L-arabinose transferase